MYHHVVIIIIMVTVIQYIHDTNIIIIGILYSISINAVSTTTRSLSLTCPDVTDYFGKTPLDYAVHYRSTEVVEYLRSLQPSTPKPGMCL